MFGKHTKRILISICSGFGFFLISYMFTYVSPRIHEKLQEAIDKYGNVSTSQLAPPELVYFTTHEGSYPWGYYVCIFGLVVGIVVFFMPRIISFMKSSNERFMLCVSDFAVFSLIGCITIANFGLDFSYLVWIAAFGVFIGIIDGVQSSKITISPTDGADHQPMPIQVKLQKLQMEYDKWFRGLTLFTAFLVAGAIAGAFQIIISSPPPISDIIILLHVPILLYAGLGLGIGLYWEILSRINWVTNEITKVVETPECDAS